MNVAIVQVQHLIPRTCKSCRAQHLQCKTSVSSLPHNVGTSILRSHHNTSSTDFFVSIESLHQRGITLQSRDNLDGRRELLHHVEDARRAMEIREAHVGGSTARMDETDGDRS